MRIDIGARWGLSGSEEQRRAALEGVLVPIRWGAIVMAAVNSQWHLGTTDAVSWAVTGMLLATNLVVIGVLNRYPSVDRLRRLGVVVFVADFTAVGLVMFNNASFVDNGIYLALVLPLFEAALRWERAGGFGAGAFAALLVFAWMFFRREQYGIEMHLSAVVFRAGMQVLVGAIAGQTVRALSQGRQQLSRQLRQSEALHRFAFEAPRLDVSHAAQRIADVVLELGYQRACVMLLDEERARLDIAAVAGYWGEPVDAFQPVPLGRGVTGRAIRTRLVQVVPDVRNDPDYLMVDPETRSELVLPLMLGDRVLGVLDIAATEVDAFGDDDLLFLATLAGQLAQALENARLGAVERSTIDELRTLNLLKDDFVSIASHELRTPLTSLRGFAKTLLHRDLSPQQVHEFLVGIDRQADRLAALVEDLLAVGRIEGGRAIPSLEAIVLADLVDDCFHDFELSDGLHKLVNEVPPGLQVHADVSFLRRVVVNLVANAIRYSPPATTVSVSCETDVDGHQAWVRITDEGFGISATDLPRLFGKFSRIMAPDRPPGGTGLGLFIVKGLVEVMGGHVAVDSTPGEGSVFSFSIPLVQVGALP